MQKIDTGQFDGPALSDAPSLSRCITEGLTVPPSTAAATNPRIDEPQLKLYHSIREVAEMTELKPFVLRFWETEFPQLRPKTTRGGRRQYRVDDIKLLLLIKKLLYQDGYTINGARRRLKEIKDKELPQMELPFDNMRRLAAVSRAVAELRDLVRFIDGGGKP
ncbi:MAG: MerR family transcriptional regulator [Candidatus Edwardsbacteria bacterium]|nr:MerR family transcriptional regulator [Candidatus Edwardsbacteria bacterium]